MSESHAVVELADRYVDAPAIRALVQMLPFGLGAAADLLVAARVQSIRADRARTFFDRLSSGEAEITPDLIESEDFLHCYFSTASAALRSRRREKATLLADLLLGGICEDVLGEDDDYEEILAVLDSMSLREIRSLTLIEDTELTNPKRDDENDLTWARRHAPRIHGRLTGELGIAESETSSFVQRLSRTGLVEEILMGEDGDSATLSFGWATFKVTDRYRRLKRLIQSGQRSALQDRNGDPDVCRAEPARTR